MASGDERLVNVVGVFSNGGSGATTLAANNVLLGNGSSAMQVVAPSTSGNVLTSNGTTWQSTTPVSSPSVRQTVNSGPVDTAGLPTFLPATSGSLTLTPSFVLFDQLHLRNSIIGLIVSYVAAI